MYPIPLLLGYYHELYLGAIESWASRCCSERVWVPL